MKLFEPQIPKEQWHNNFKAFMLYPNGFDMDVIQNWANGFKDRDGKFVQEFQKTFNSCFWELYLFAVLKFKGFKVDFSYYSPDFVVPDPGFCIEAVTANQALNAEPEHKSFFCEVPDDFNEFNRQAIIRQSNAIKSKSEKYNTHYKHLPHVKDKPFIIALAPFDRPYFMIEAQRPIEAVLFGYYVDEELRISGKVSSIDEAKMEIDSVIKNNGAEIPLGIFNDSSFSHISAVIYSTLATKGKVRALSTDPRNNSKFSVLRYNSKSEKPVQQEVYKTEYSERLLDGIHLFHNPFATNPLDHSLFRAPGINQVYFNSANGSWVHEMKDGDIVFRMVHTLVEPNEV